MKRIVATLICAWTPLVLLAGAPPTNLLAVVTTAAEELAFIRGADKIDVVLDPWHAESVLTISNPDAIRGLAATVSKEQVEPVHIHSVRQFHGALFIQVAFDGHGADFIVIRADDATFTGAKSLLSWIE